MIPLLVRAEYLKRRIDADLDNFSDDIEDRRRKPP
jgi:hypothetical protein